MLNCIFVLRTKQYIKSKIQFKMNRSKFLAGIFIGAAAYFAASYLTYQIIFGSALDAACPNMQTIMVDAPDLMTIIIGCIATGLLLTYLFESLGSVKTMMAGLYHGVIIGCLVAVSYDAMMLATTNIYTWNGLVLDTMATIINIGVSGGVVGWWLGYNRN